jgi:RNA-binding protein YlmH
MEQQELRKRAEELAERAERQRVVAATGFLTPAEQYDLAQYFRNRRDVKLHFAGGAEGCERQAAFFLPDWLEPELLDVSEYICAFRLTAHFGTPGHRDYMGALLGMGIGREWLGDIWVDGDTAIVFCLPSVERHLLSIEKAGRVSVRAQPIALADLPPRVRKVKEISFSVQSLRLDAIVAGMFHLSRSEAARQIALGAVSINYSETLKPDYAVKEGDILSLRGSGKGQITALGGLSKKGRQFVTAEIWQ